MRRFVVAYLLVLAVSVGVLAQWAVPPNGNPAPAFVPVSVCFPACVMPTDIVAADFNQNGWLELAVSCSSTGNVWWYADTAGVAPFLGPAPFFASAAGVLPTASYLLAGVNSPYDGHPDLFIVCEAAPGAGLSRLAVVGRTFPPVGGAWFPAAFPALPGLAAVLPGTPAPPGRITGIAAGSFTIDNVADFAYITNLPSAWCTWSAGGGPSAAAALPAGWGGTPVAVATGDFDQNGLDDVAMVTSAPNTLWVWFNATLGAAVSAGPAVFAPPVAVALGIPVPTAMAVGDFDADGFPDIVVVGNQPANASGVSTGLAQVFMNQVHQGPGTFVALVPPGPMGTWGFNSTDVAVLDADGNGRDDFAVANWGSATVTVFLSDANAFVIDARANTRPTGNKTFPPNGWGPCLSDTDLNPDRFQITFKLFKYELQCGYYPVALAPGDFDRNGKQDLAVALQSATEELCAQNESCIEVIYDVACGFTPAQGNVTGQSPHTIDPEKESTTCPVCKPEEAGGSGKP